MIRCIVVESNSHSIQDLSLAKELVLTHLSPVKNNDKYMYKIAKGSAIP